MRIGELAERTGVSPRSLRYYEQQGLLKSHRTGGGQRQYEESAVARVHRIQQLFSAGMNSTTIYKILPCIRDQDGGPSANADETLTADLLEERVHLQRRIKDLQASLQSLDQVIDDAQRPLLHTVDRSHSNSGFGESWSS